MMMKINFPITKKAIGAFLGAFLLIYITSYCFLSKQGYYGGLTYGLMKVGDEYALVPKSSYVWIPLKKTQAISPNQDKQTNKDALRMIYYIYFPLYMLDRKLWHKDTDFPEGLNGVRHPVENYFNWDTLSYTEWYNPKQNSKNE